MRSNAISRIEVYEFGKFKLDAYNRELLADDQKVHLTDKSYEVLLYLVKNAGRVVKKQQLLDSCWEEVYVHETCLVQHIYRVRTALRKASGDLYIETVAKVGYKFIGEVTEHSNLNDHNVEKEFDNPGDWNGSVYSGNTSDAFMPKDSNKLGNKEHLPELTGAREVEINRRYFSRKMWIRLFVASSVVMISGLLINNLFLYKGVGSEPIDIKSVAILPFERVGADRNDRLGLGLTDALITRLSVQRKIAILPTIAVTKFSGRKGDNPLRFGEELGVDAVIFGTIGEDSESLIADVQIIDVKRNVLLWSENFRTKTSDPFLLQDKIFREMVSKFSINTKSFQNDRLEIQGSKNIEAYKAYSNGLFHWSRRSTGELSKALDYFRTAIEKDPKFANAYAMLADSYSLIGYRKRNLMPPKEAMLKAQKYANKALELNPGSSQALTTLALVEMQGNRMNEARVRLNQAIGLNANNSTAYRRLAWIDALEGNLESAVNKMRIAHKSDPQSLGIIKTFATYLILARKPDEALALSQRVMEATPPSEELNIFLAEVYEQKREYRKALSELEVVSKKKPDNCPVLLGQSRIYAKIGNVGRSREIMFKVLNNIKCQNYQYGIALTHVHLGEKNKAIALVRKVEGDVWHLLMLKNDFNLDPIRDSSVFQQYVSQYEKKLKQSSAI